MLLRWLYNHMQSVSYISRESWVWGSKIIVRYILSSVCRECVKLSQFSQLSFMQYMRLCVFSLPISPMMTVRMCVLISLSSSNRMYSYLPLFKFRAWHNGMRCMPVYILTKFMCQFHGRICGHKLHLPDSRKHYGNPNVYITQFQLPS